MISCESCKADDGRPVYRTAPKGEAPHWMCAKCTKPARAVEGLAAGIESALENDHRQVGKAIEELHCDEEDGDALAL